MARRDLNGMRAIVTGASSGIGRALAVELARHGVRCVLVARSGDKLADVQSQTRHAGTEASLQVGDITQREVRTGAIDMARHEFGGLDLVVNNAGISGSGTFAEGSPEILRKIFEVNFFAAAELVREVIPDLRRGQSPMVVNIGSILGHRGIPFTSEYCASKFALTGFSQSLRAELAPLGIDVLLVSPGTTETELSENLVEQRVRLPWAGMKGVTAERVAQATVSAIERGKHEIVPNWRGWGLLFAHRLTPNLVDWVMARIARKSQR